MAGKKKKIILSAVLLCCIAVVMVFLLLKGGGGADEVPRQTAAAQGEVHEVAPNAKSRMENERFLLELDEATMGITLTDKESGAVFGSVQDYSEGNATWNGFLGSGVSLEFYTGTSTVATTVSVKSEAPKTKIQYYEDGFDADLEFETSGFGMQLQVRLTQDGVSVCVPGASLSEGDTNKLGAVWLYPMFGSTYLGEKDGYMVIPEGAGALIDLKDNKGKYKTAYSKMIYGNNAGIRSFEANRYGVPVVTEPEKITMPVFGMVYEQEGAGFLAALTDGEYNAELAAYPNGVLTPFNWIGAKFHIRDVYTRQTAADSGVPSVEAKGDFRTLGIRYIIPEGKADYTVLANAYQDYLVKEGTLVKKEDVFQEKLDFLGADSKKWLLFNTTVPMTSVEQMDEILADLAKSSVTDVAPCYFGWQDGGVTLGYGSSDLTIDSHLGSKKELTALAQKLDAQGSSLTLAQELLLANSSRLYNTSTDIVKGVNQVILEKPTYQKLFQTMYYMTPYRAMNLAEQFMREYGDTPIGSVSISGLTQELYSYYSNENTYTRAECALQYKKAVEGLAGMRIGMTAPNQYLWEDMSQYYDLSMTTSNYNFISREIPFLPIVLRGYVPYWASYANFEANQEEFFLKMLEYGAYPSFLVSGESPVELRNTNSSYIYTSEYSVLKEKIVDYYERIGEILSQVEGVGIAEHTVLEADVVRVAYKNGVTLLINYSDQDYAYQGVTVPALSCYQAR